MFRRKDENDLLNKDQNSGQNTNANAGYNQPANAPSAAGQSANAQNGNHSQSNMQSGDSAVAGVPGYAAANAAVSARSNAAEAPKVASTPQASANYRPVAPSAARAQAATPSSSMSGNAPGSNAQGNKGSRRVLTVGNDILLKGEIATCDRLVIEGKVDATLKDVHTVELAQTGSFKGTAEVEDAEISGLFEGDLIVRNRLVIYSTGKVRGKITYGEIEIERGGELTGEINSQATSSANAASAPKRAAA